jgi:propanol-preferring alcohol dehydrogenase
MRAAVVKDFTQPLDITEVPTPEPGPGEVLVLVEASRVDARVVRRP